MSSEAQASDSPSIESKEDEGRTENRSEASDGSSEGSGWLWCGLILFNGTVGGGLLNMPYSLVKCGGLAIGLPILLLSSALAFVANLILSFCADLGQHSASFQDLMHKILGKWGRLGCAGSISLLMFFGDVYLLVGIADMLETGVLDVVGKASYCGHWYYRREFLSAVLTLLLILPPSLVRHIDKLKYISGLAVVSIGVVVFATVWEWGSLGSSGTLPASPAVWTDVFLAIPGISIGFSNCYGSVSIYDRVRPRRTGVFAKSLGVAFALTTAVYALCGVFAALLYGTGIQSDFTKNFETAGRGGVERGVLIAAFASYSVKLCFEFPVVQFVGWQCLESLVGDRGLEWLSARGLTERRRRVGVSVVWVALCWVLGNFWPSVEYFSPLLAVLAILTTAVFPGLCLLRAVDLYPESLRARDVKYALGTACLLIVLGSFMIGLVLGQVDKDIGAAEPPLCG